MTVDVKFIICMDSCYRPSQLKKGLCGFSRNACTKKEQKIKQPQRCVNTATDHLFWYGDSYLPLLLKYSHLIDKECI